MSASEPSLAAILVLLVATIPSGFAQNITRATARSGSQVIEADINHKGQNTERDSDGDGISDVRESQLGTNPNSVDTDGDGMTDGVEAAYGSNPLVQNAALDVVYRVTKLPVPAGYIGAEITDIGNGDFATGYAYPDTGPDLAVRWNLRTGGVEVADGADYAYPRAVNDSGVVAGQYDSQGGFRWLPAQTLQLIGAPFQTFSAWDVNSAGDVVGEAYKTAPSDTGAFLLKAGSTALSHLATLPEYAVARAIGINDKGQVGGMVYSPSANKVSSVIWNNGTPTLLEVLGSNNRGRNFVYGIGENGTVFGIKDRKARIWPQAGGTQILPTTPAEVNSYPWKMIGTGEIIGEMNGNSVIWRPDGQGGWTIVDINSSILDADPDVRTEFYAYSMNDQGQIAGGYYSYENFEYHPVILTPMLRPSLAVDANRDGTIKLASEDASDATTAANPYRFWINDDDDVSYNSAAWSDSDPEHYPPTRADSGDQFVNSRRDCEDLPRLWINAEGLIDALKDQSGDLYLGLKWKNTTGTPSIRLFASADPDGGLGHIKDAQIALRQWNQLGFCLADADAQFDVLGQTTNITTVAPSDRAADFILRKHGGRSSDDVFGTRSTGYLLFEGVQEGKGELMLVIARKKSDGTWEKVSDGGSVWLQLDNIRRMYVRAHSLPLSENFSLPWQVNSPPPGPYDEDLAHEKALSIPDNRLWYGAGDSVESSGQFPFVASPGEQNKCVIFVHGIDLDVPTQQGYAQSFYKRLWWEGYRGRFVAFRWCTTLSSDGLWFDERFSIFNSGEYRSWKGGSSLKKFVDALRDRASPFHFSSNPTIGLLAHSLGNACAGEALRQGMQVNSYVALKAAVPLSCYYPVGIAAPTNQILVTADTNSPTPQYEGSLNGYHGYLSSIGGANKVNYFGAKDFWLETGSTSFALSVDWVTNMRKYKPDDPPDVLNVYVIKYLWDATQQKAYFRKIADVDWNRLVTDPHESMAYVSRPRTSALGAVAAPPGFSGLDLDSTNTYGFTEARFDHSGPFQRNIQLMYGNENGAPWSEPLYVRLMRDLQATP